MPPRTYSAKQYENVSELLVSMSARYAALQAECDRLRGQIRVMQARDREPVLLYECFDTPDLTPAIKAKARGLGQRGIQD